MYLPKKNWNWNDLFWKAIDDEANKKKQMKITQSSFKPTVAFICFSFIYVLTAIWFYFL